MILLADLVPWARDCWRYQGDQHLHLPGVQNNRACLNRYAAGEEQCGLWGEGEEGVQRGGLGEVLGEASLYMQALRGEDGALGANRIRPIIKV